MPNSLFTSQPWAILPESLEKIVSLANVHSGKSAPFVRTNYDVAHQSLNATKLYGVERNVAVIEISGPIGRKAFDFFFVSFEGQDRIKSAIEAALVDGDVDAILLSVDSPGGPVSGTKELSDYIAGVSSKPIYTYVDGLCASAAFWLASATQGIYAPATAMVGSIGVLSTHYDQSKALEGYGLKVTHITSGHYKAMGNGAEPLSTEAYQYILDSTTSIHNIFKADVASHLSLDLGSAQRWADGQVFLAAEALSLGLIKGIVTSRGEVIENISKEISMDLATLQKDHPDLFAKVQADAMATGKASVQSDFDKKLEGEKKNFLAITSQVVGEEATAKISSLLDVGVESSQLQAIMAVVGTQQPQPPVSGASADDKKGKILAGIMQASSGPVDVSGTVETKPDSVQSVVARIVAPYSA